MQDCMVTGRVTAHKKEEGNKVLARMGLTSSQAINLLYDKLIAEGNAEFLGVAAPSYSAAQWQEAAAFVQGLQLSPTPEFDGMTKAQIKAQRLAARGLM